MGLRGPSSPTYRGVSDVRKDERRGVAAKVHVLVTLRPAARFPRSLSEQAPWSTTNRDRLVLRFERRLRRRNPFLGDARRGAVEAPFDCPHPLTDPATRPSTIQRWTKMYRATTGIVVMTEAAMSWPQWNTSP